MPKPLKKSGTVLGSVFAGLAAAATTWGMYFKAEGGVSMEMALGATLTVIGLVFTAIRQRKAING